MSEAQTPEEAVRLMLTDVQNHNWKDAHARLANASRYRRARLDPRSGGQQRQPAHLRIARRASTCGDSIKTNALPSVRAKLHYSTAVGALDDVRDMKVQRSGDAWKVVWPTNTLPKLAPQVIPVNYLRWDIINRGAGDDWGVQNVDSPQVRIVSMNALERPGSHRARRRNRK